MGKNITSIFSGKYTYHLLFTIAYIILLIPSRKLYVGHDDWQTFLPIFCVHMLLMLMMIGVNTSILMPRLVRTQRTVEYIFFIILLVVLYVLIKGLYDAYSIARLYKLEIQSYNSYFLNALPYAIWFAVISSMLYMAKAQYESKQRLKNIQIVQLETELKYLKSQINPHFLFNGLNTIFGFIEKSNYQAKDALIQFSDLLRYNLYDADVDKIELAKEAAYLESYVAIQRLRSNANLNIDLHINVDMRDMKVAPLLFLPFVENAFKYVSHDDDKLNFVQISLVQKDNKVSFECINSFDNSSTERKGIGLENVKRRLDLLYHEKYDLFLSSEEGKWHVMLNIST